MATEDAIPALVDRLARARARLRATRTLESTKAAHAEALDAERALAAARGEPHAVPIEFPVQWCAGAPLPRLVQSDYDVFLVFLLRDQPPIPSPPPGADRNAPWVVEGSAKSQRLALVEFQGCVAARLGTPNEEVHQGHPLWGKGFDGYAAQRVVHSPWLAELEGINSVHERYAPERWRARRHFLFPFHDSLFECIAESFVVEERTGSLSDVLREACERLR